MSRPSLNSTIWDQPRGQNLLDGGAPWYDVYETRDGLYMSVGALENPFYTIFLKTLLSSLNPSLIPSPPPSPYDQMDRSTWPALASFLAIAFLSKTRNEWTSIFISTDSCCVPVLNKNEVDANGVGFDEPGVMLTEEEREGDGGVPVAAPRLMKTPARGGEAYEVGRCFFLTPGKDTREVLKEAGLEEDVVRLVRENVIGIADEEDVKAKL
jgi:alpha-methylacyl-CoA racemase